MKPLYQTQVSVSGGRNGHARSADGVLDLQLAMPRELGGSGPARSNPEMLFAAGFAACFDSALALVARQQKLALKDSEVTATVGIGPNDAGGFELSVALAIRLPGLARDQALELIAATERVCPYSNAVRGNIAVELQLVEAA